MSESDYHSDAGHPPFTTNKRKNKGKKRSRWSVEERALLKEHVEDFRTADVHGRRSLLSTKLLPNFFALPQYKRTTEDQRKELTKEIKAWFQNCARRKGIKERLQIARKSSVRQVVFQEKADEIRQRVARQSGVEPRHKQYPGSFQRAVSEIIDDMSDGSLEVVEKKRQEWEREGYPTDVQQKLAETNGRRVIESFLETAFKHMGMRCILLECHVTKKSKTVLSLHDLNDELGDPPPKKMEGRFPDEADKMKDMFAKYVQYLMDTEKDGGEEAGLHLTKGQRIRHVMKLETDDEGYPLLPDTAVDVGSAKSDADMKHLVWSFLTMHYVLATRRPAAVVPFPAVSADQDKFIDVEHVPSTITIKDPSDMHRSDVEKLLRYWRERQAKLEPRDVFRWKKVLSGQETDSPRAAAAYPMPEGSPERRRRSVTESDASRPSEQKEPGANQYNQLTPIQTDGEGDIVDERPTQSNLGPKATWIASNDAAYMEQDQTVGTYWDSNINLLCPSRPPATYPTFSETNGIEGLPVKRKPVARPIQLVRFNIDEHVNDDHFLHHRAQRWGHPRPSFSNLTGSGSQQVSQIGDMQLAEAAADSSAPTHNEIDLNPSNPDATDEVGPLMRSWDLAGNRMDMDIRVVQEDVTLQHNTSFEQKSLKKRTAAPPTSSSPPPPKRMRKPAIKADRLMQLVTADAEKKFLKSRVKRRK